MRGGVILDNETWGKTIIKAKKGNKKALEKIIYMYGDNLFGYIYNMTRDTNTAEDIYQDVWIKVLMNLDSYKESQPFSPWLITVAKNTIYDYSRKEKKVSIRLIINTQEDTQEDPEKELIEKERLQILTEYINQLSEHDKTIIILKYFEELSNDEIANILKSDAKTIKWQLYEAKKRLKKKIYGKEDILWNAN